MKVNKKELAEIFDISERSFTEYQKDPSFPIEVDAGRGKSNVYDTGEVFRWLVARSDSQKSETAKERLDRLRGDREELAYGKDIEELVLACGVERRLAEVATAIRAGMMSGNTKLKNEIDLTHGISLDIDILNDHARHILTHLSEVASQPGSGDQPCAAGTETAAKTVE